MVSSLQAWSPCIQGLGSLQSWHRVYALKVWGLCTQGLGSYTSGLWSLHSRPGSLYSRPIWLDLQRYIRIRISTAYYFTRTCTEASKFISIIYFIKEFEVVNKKILRFITNTIIKITFATSDKNK